MLGETNTKFSETKEILFYKCCFFFKLYRFLWLLKIKIAALRNICLFFFNVGFKNHENVFAMNEIYCIKNKYSVT